MKLCPLDSVALTRKKYESEIIWKCNTCQGVLITEDEMFAISRKQDTSIDELKLEYAAVYNGDNGIMINCPKCNFEMEKHSPFEGKIGTNRGGIEDFEIDVCPSCSSIWLDAGEIEKIQMDFQSSLKGSEYAKSYVDFKKLPNTEKKEYIESVCSSVPDNNKILSKTFFEAMVDVFGECIGCYVLGSRGSR